MIASLVLLLLLLQLYSMRPRSTLRARLKAFQRAGTPVWIQIAVPGSGTGYYRGTVAMVGVDYFEFHSWNEDGDRGEFLLTVSHVMSITPYASWWARDVLEGQFQQPAHERAQKRDDDNTEGAPSKP